MADLRACPSCRRHVLIEATQCPFCAAALPVAAPPEIPRGRFSRAAVFAGLALSGPAACWTDGKQGAQQTTPPTTTGSGDNATFATPPPDETAPAGDAKQVAPQPARLEGTITNSRTGQALAGYAVALNNQSGVVGRLATDGNGHYAFAGLAPGDYTVMFGQPHPRTGPITVKLTLRAGEARRLDRAIYVPEPSNIPMPYGAPPVRDRII